MHGHQQRLPKEIQVLVTSPECEVEAISVKGRPHIVGLQFDNHAAALSDVRNWVEGDEKWLSGPPSVDIEALVKDAEEFEAFVGEAFELMFTNYIRLISCQPPHKFKNEKMEPVED